MLRVAFAIGVLFLLATASAPATGDDTVDRPADQGARSWSTVIRRLAQAERALTICRPRENLCRMATYITWCCRADQRCDYSAVGGCR